MIFGMELGFRFSIGKISPILAFVLCCHYHQLSYWKKANIEGGNSRLAFSLPRYATNHHVLVRHTIPISLVIDMLPVALGGLKDRS
jgi:hypothetical protein